MTEIKRNNIAEDEMTLKELFLQIRYYIYILLKNSWIILLLGILGFGIGYYMEREKPVIYTASTSFVLESGAGGGRINNSGLSGMLGLDIGGSTNNLFQGESLLELYRSKSIIQEVLLSSVQGDSSMLLIQKLFMINQDLQENISENDQRLVSDINFLISPGQENLRQRDSILNNAVKLIRREYLSVFYPNSKANIIRVDVNAEDELFAKSFNTYLVSKVNDLYMEIKAGKSYQNIKVLQNKVDSVTSVLNAAISSSAASVDRTPNLNPTKGALRTVPTQQAQLNVETSKNLLVELNRNLEMAKLGLSKEAPLIKIIDESTYPLDKTYPKAFRQGVIWAIISVFLTITLIIGVFFYRKIMSEE